MAPVRWYNRLAAWLWPLLGERWMNLCVPVWAEEAEREFAEEYECAACRELEGWPYGLAEEDDSALPF